VILLIASIGVMFMLNAVVRLVIGPDDQRFADGERFIITAGQFKTLTGLEEGLAVHSTKVVTIILAVVVMAALFAFLKRSRTGKAMRAFSDNEDLALLSGVDPDRVVMITWIIAGASGSRSGR
jgi:branched-chain amino acid transport system permease protein